MSFYIFVLVIKIIIINKARRQFDTIEILNYCRRVFFCFPPMRKYTKYGRKTSRILLLYVSCSRVVPKIRVDDFAKIFGNF